MPKRVRKRADNPTSDGTIAFVSEAFIKREKDKARLLRQSQWWKAKCAAGVCHYCGGSVQPSELTMDHIIPVSKGGMSIKSNVATACKGCNISKRHSLTFQWTSYMESLRQ